MSMIDGEWFAQHMRESVGWTRRHIESDKRQMKQLRIMCAAALGFATAFLVLHQWLMSGSMYFLSWCFIKLSALYRRGIENHERYINDTETAMAKLERLAERAAQPDAGNRVIN